MGKYVIDIIAIMINIVVVINSDYLMSQSRATPRMVQCLGPMSLSKSMDPM